MPATEVHADDTMTRHIIGKVADITPGQRRRVVVDNRAVVVFNIKGEFLALADTCPHRGGSLSLGILTGLVTSSEPGRYDYTREGEIIRCPWHAWEFDVRTGRSHCDPARMRAMQFPVTVEPGTAVIEGPYKADKFPVSIEDDYIVIEVA